MAQKKRKKIRSKDPIKQEILNITRPPKSQRSVPVSSIIESSVKKIDRLRFKYNYKDLNKIYDGLPQIYKDSIYNRNLANTLKDVGRGNFGFETSEENLQQQLNWFTLISIRHSDEINKFLIQKQNFEYQFLHAHYDKAENIINSTSKDITYSFWSMYNHWLLKEYAYNIDDKIEYLSELGAEDTDSVIYHLLAIYFGRMVENDISIQRYLDKVNLEVYKNYNIENSQIRYFLESYLNPNQVFFTDSTSGIFLGDEESSIIDIYINLQKIILNNVLSEKMDMSIVVNRLLENINDDKLENIKLLMSNEEINFSNKASNKTSRYFELLDVFTSEKYRDSLNMARVFLEKYEGSIDIYEIYIKSHIYLDLPFKAIGNDNSILNKILKNIHDILLKNDNLETALVELSHLSFNLSGFDISKELVYFITTHTKQNELALYKKISMAYSSMVTPSLIDILAVNKKVYLMNLKTISNGQNLTIHFFEKLLEYENNLDALEKINMPKYRINIYKARILFQQKMYGKVLETINPILLEVKKFPHLLSEILNLLYISNQELGNINDCVILYIKYYFENKNLINYISIENIIPLITEKKFKNIPHSIELPIFFHISKSKEYFLFTSYRIFMKSENLKKPSEINCEKLPLKYIIYFLKYKKKQKVLCTDVLNFNSQISLDNERVKICQLLAKVDEKNAKIYNDEIVEITQNIKIKERINEIDNSKIYVDNKGVINYDLKDFHNHFLRYRKTYDSLTSHKEELKFLSLGANNKDLENNLQTKKNYISSRDQLRNMFEELFFEVRDAYLFSNGHGLDYYLSTRIRHGHIEGQLRKPFSNDKLITVKDSDTKEYKNNTELINKLRINENEKEELFDIFKEFSKDIDQLITDIKDEYVHIKTENISTKQNGFFDFSSHMWHTSLSLTFSDTFMGIQDNEEFIEESLKYCQKMTNANLTRIRYLFSNQIKQGFIYYLDTLEKKLKKLFFISELNDIINSIAHCRTEIQKEIDIISSWFEQKNKVSMDFIISDAVDTSIEIIRNIFPTIKLKIEKKIDSSFIIKGALFSHFVDCFKIFLENSVDNAIKNNLKENNISIDILTVDNKIVCKICNELSQDTDFEALSHKIFSINENISKNLNTSKMREDKNSGLMKVNNMIKNVIGDKSNYLTIDLIEDKVCVEFDFNLKRCT